MLNMNQNQVEAAMDQTRTIQERFGAAAAAYAVSAVHRGGPDLDAMLAAGVRTGRERALDLGCGAGATALAFAERVASEVAYDLTTVMLDQARRQAIEAGHQYLHLDPSSPPPIPNPSPS